MISKKTLSDSGILVSATLLGGLCNIFFNRFIGNMLGPAIYSEVTSLFSLLVIISVPIVTIQTVVAKYAAKYNAISEQAKIKSLLFGISERLFIGSLVFFVVLVVFSKFIANYLKLTSIVPVILLGTVLLPSSILPVNRGALQGIQKFFDYSINSVVEVLSKLFFGVLLVYMGWKTNGAVFSLTIAAFLALVISIFQLKKVFIPSKVDKNKLENKVFQEMFKYSWFVILNVLCFTILTNITMILVKHYFPADLAGLYAGAEVVGKIIMFITGVIPILMFPKTASLHAKNVNSKKILIKSLLVTAFIGLLFVLNSFVFNEIIMMLFFGNKYLIGSVFLGPLTIVMVLFSLFNIMSTYQLSINKFEYLYGTIIITIGQICLIALFHKSITSVINILIICSAIIVILNAYYSLFQNNKIKNNEGAK